MLVTLIGSVQRIVYSQSWAGQSARCQFARRANQFGRFLDWHRLPNAKRREKLRARKNRFHEPFQSDLGGPVPNAKKFRFPFRSIRWQFRRIPPRSEGRCASSRTLSAGCDGRGGIVGRTMLCADGEVVWFWHPLAGAKSRGVAMSALAGPTRCNLQATVTNKSWTPGRARRKP